MTDTRQILPGSRHSAPHGMQASGRVASGDLITVSIYLRPETTEPAAADAAAPIHSRATMRQAREQAQAANIAAVTAFAAQTGLDVVHVDATQRRIQLRGPASALEAAFGTELRQYQHDGATYRGREGDLSVPNDLAYRILAVLGLDTTPVATPKFVPHRGTTQPRGFLPTEVAALYGIGGWNAAGQCIGIIELGGGYTAPDNQAAFSAMSLPVPEIIAISVGSAEVARFVCTGSRLG